MDQEMQPSVIVLSPVWKLYERAVANTKYFASAHRTSDQSTHSSCIYLDDHQRCLLQKLSLVSVYYVEHLVSMNKHIAIQLCNLILWYIFCRNTNTKYIFFPPRFTSSPWREFEWMCTVSSSRLLLFATTKTEKLLNSSRQHTSSPMDPTWARAGRGSRAT